MEKLSKKDLREKLFEFKENPIKTKEYIEDLICVNKGYLYYGSINLDETFFIHTKDFKEQLNEDISEMRRISEENPLMEEDEDLYYEKNKDIEYSKVQIGASFYKDLKNESSQIINNLKDDSSYKMRVNNTLVRKIDKINNSLENIEGSFLLEYTPYLSSLYLTKKNENDEFKTKTYNFMGNELQKEEPSYKEFYARKKYKENDKIAYEELNAFLNSGSKSKEDFLNLESGFNSFTDESIINRKNRFSKVELNIVPDLQEKNYIKIVKDDEELTVNGKDVNLGELIVLDNSRMFLFYKEQDKVKEHEKTLDEMTYEVRKIKRELEKESFQSLKENVYSLILNDDNIREIKGKEFLNNSIGYSRLAKIVKLEVDMFSTKFYELEKKNELKEERKLSYKEKDIEKEKTEENSKDDFDFGIE